MKLTFLSFATVPKINKNLSKDFIMATLFKWHWSQQWEKYDTVNRNKNYQLNENILISKHWKHCAYFQTPIDLGQKVYWKFSRIGSNIDVSYNRSQFKIKSYCSTIHPGYFGLLPLWPCKISHSKSFLQSFIELYQSLWLHRLIW